MVLSDSAERIVFVHDRPGDEAWLTGGTIARLSAEGATVTVLFGDRAPGDTGENTGETTGENTSGASAEPRAALGELGVIDWRVLPAAPDARELAGLIGAVLAETGATAVVVGARQERLRSAATDAAAAASLPAFVSSRVADAIGQRLIAIDVSDHVDGKLRAIGAYPDRWTVTGRTVSAVGLNGPAGQVTGTETYRRLPATRGGTNGPGAASGAAAAGAAAEGAAAAGAAAEGAAAVGAATSAARRLARPAGAAPAGGELPTWPVRALASLVAASTGAAFGVLGTIAHQATVVLGPVTLPTGLILAVVAASALLVGLRLVLDDRVVSLSATVGLVGTIFVLSLRSTGGSVLVPEGIVGVLWTVLPTLVAALVLAWPRLPARPERRATPDATN